MKSIIFKAKVIDECINYKYENVLLIDDNRMDLLIEKNQLRTTNFAEKTYTFTSAKAALNFLENAKTKRIFEKAAKPIVIFTDLYMPNMNGFEFVKHFEDFELGFKDKFRIYLVSNCANPIELMQAKNYTSIYGIFHKSSLANKLASW